MFVAQRTMRLKYTVCFSIVAYRHDLDYLRPVLDSIRSLLRDKRSQNFNILVYLHENIKDNPLLSNTELAAYYSDVKITYHSSANIGFGKGHNSNFSKLRHCDQLDTLFIVCNPDISFDNSDLYNLFYWVIMNPFVAAVAPLIIRSNKTIQFSAKTNPTLLSLALGRLTHLQKIPLLYDYYCNHTRSHIDYNTSIIPSSYLSGCFMVIPAKYYKLAKGFDPQFFLHMEDADITRSLGMYGLTLHVPLAAISHNTVRASHNSPFHILCIIKSYIYYISKWGFTLL